MPEETSLSNSRTALAPVLAVLSVIATAALLAMMLFCGGSNSVSAYTQVEDAAVMDRYDMFMTNAISDALDGIWAVEKVFWLSDRDLVAPEPNPACYGQVSSPAELMWLLDEAADLIDGQQMLFNENTAVWIGEPIYYYYDETILVITWKEAREGSMFTISEVKIAHPSQFRRFLADGEYGSDKQYTTTEMAASVNAVVASSGDFYKFRQYGTIVYNDTLQRFEGEAVDTCFIDDKGDLHFVRRNELRTQAEAQQYVDENNIRFSLAFGPVLVDDGAVCQISGYIIGEVKEQYSRAALCQMDQLHYLLVNSCAEGGYVDGQNIQNFAKIIGEMGVQKAYALDGGQTTVIAMNDELISNVDFGTQRRISDIIYFATAMPEGD
ncbi:MAG: phosphodiester glycosidase family protein [Oscillospiraceae bacterium]|nr:phosphodiester glycosidase family protein [Oscillospiraceae bacterium]